MARLLRWKLRYGQWSCKFPLAPSPFSNYDENEFWSIEESGDYDTDNTIYYFETSTHSYKCNSLKEAKQIAQREYNKAVKRMKKWVSKL